MQPTRLLWLVAFASAAAWAASAGCSSDSDPADVSSSAGTGGAPDAATTSSSAIVGSTSGGGGELPDVFTVTGVVTDGTQPLEGAMVLQGGAAKPAMVTGADGAYSVELTKDIPGVRAVVATKVGYRTRGVEFLELPSGPVDIALRYVTPNDNESYLYGNPGKGDVVSDNSTLYCGHCHTTLVKQFQTSAHAKATKDPLVQDLYAGVSEAHPDMGSCEQAGGIWRTGLVPGTAATAAPKCYLGSGVLPDLNPVCAAGQMACDYSALPAAQKPKAFGRCADCHAPGIDGPAGGRNLHEAVGIAFDNGNHCDVCHHVGDIDPAKPPGVAGRLVLRRPVDKVSDDPNAKVIQVMFGPLLDVANEFMGGSLQPKFATSELCSGCHEQKQEALLPGASLDASRWPDGLPTHSTFTEWSESTFNTPNTPCQSCHMPADDTGLSNTVDVTDETNASITFGFVRPPEQIRKHIFRGPLEGSPRLIDQAVQVFVAPSTNGPELTVDVTVANIGAGHAMPTGEPMRSLVLVVQAEGCGSPLIASGGMTLNDLAGAAAEGVVGSDVSVAGTTLTWAAGALRAKAGDLVRVVRPTGTFDDYAGIGFFANPALTPAEKGLEIRTPVGEATVASVGSGTVTLGAALATQPGDLVYVGDPLPASVADGDATRFLAGAPGYVFGRTLVDPSGSRGVPHHRAVDIASDNRIGPQAQATTTHVFPIPMSCATGTVTATLLYRPLPAGLARERGWDGKDFVVSTASENVVFP